MRNALIENIALKIKLRKGELVVQVLTLLVSLYGIMIAKKIALVSKHFLKIVIVGDLKLKRSLTNDFL